MRVLSERWKSECKKMKKKSLPKKEFDKIYSKVPRAGIDLIIVKNKKILLTKRSISPFNGLWHAPGGGVFHREKVRDTIDRIAKTELGIKVKPQKLLGYLEILKDGPDRHTILLEFKCKIVGRKEPKALEQASEYKFFNKIPKKTISEQKKFIRKNWKKIFE
mgnify:CR=1 FL=1